MRSIQELIEDHPLPSLNNGRERTQEEIDLDEYGTLDCYICGQEKCAKGGVTTTREVVSGRSGGSNTYSASAPIFRRKGSRRSARVGMSHNTGRTYYKNIKVDICAECNEIDKLPGETWRAMVAFFMMLTVIPTYLYCFMFLSSRTKVGGCRLYENNCNRPDEFVEHLWHGFQGYEVANAIFVVQVILIAYLWIADNRVIAKLKANVRKKYA